MSQRLAEEMLEGSLGIASYLLFRSRNELDCAAVSKYVRLRARLGRLDCLVGLHHGVAHCSVSAVRLPGECGMRIAFVRDEAPISLSMSKYCVINTRFITS